MTHAQVLHQDEPLAYCIAQHFCGRKFHDFTDKISLKFRLVHLGETFHEVKSCQFCQIAKFVSFIPCKVTHYMVLFMQLQCNMVTSNRL